MRSSRDAYERLIDGPWKDAGMTSHDDHGHAAGMRRRQHVGMAALWGPRWTCCWLMRAMACMPSAVGHDDVQTLAATP